jgi:nucleotide-binding universal stress UspA family protein
MAQGDVSMARGQSAIDIPNGSLAQVPSAHGETRGAAVPNPRPCEPAAHGHRILVCLDLSKRAEVCVPHALSLAKTFGSTITLVHVMESPHEHAGLQTNDALGWEISRQEAQGYLEKLGETVAQALGRPVDTRLEQGRPAVRLVDLAAELGADLSVLGSRGEGGGAALTLGSTVQQVLALARSSVFIAHSSSTLPAAVTPTRILVPLDGSPRAESVLPSVARIASTYGAEILLVHIVQEPLRTALLRAPDDMDFARRLAQRLESGAIRYLDELRGQLAHEVNGVRTLVARGANEYQSLLEISQKERTDLMVLSAHGSGCDSTQSFGSVTAYLLTHSVIPLLVLQDLPARELQPVLQANEKRTPPSLRASYAPENV